MYPLRNSISLNTLKEELKQENYSNLITNFDSVLSHMEKKQLTEQESIKLKYGQKIVHNSSISNNQLIKVFDQNNIFFGIAEFMHQENILKPIKMFI